MLIGYRATGKTSVGAELARRLHRPFVDLDQVLVAEAGRSVVEIVAQGGWEEFRRREKDLVERYRHSRGQVLATGGGVVMDPENVRALRENGFIIWLTADPATLQARLDADRPRDAFRPSLTGGGTVTLAAQYSPLPVWLGSSLGMVISDGLAIWVGKILGRHLPERAIQIGAAAIFFGVGLYYAGQGLTLLW